MKASLRLLLETVKAEALVLPGHMQSTTMERERRLNIFLDRRGLGFR
jgi:hypothetical protein